MADHPDLPSVPQATVVQPRRARISVVWVIPILAAVVAVGIAVQRILNEGPTITIVFTVAQGIEAGKTFVKYKDVNIGQVTTVQLTADHTKVEVKAKIAKSAGDLMVEDAKFWVVEPRVTLSGVSGLGTLLSGNYIGFEIGQSRRPERRFTGLETPPIVTGGQPGHQFRLRAENLGSLGIGAPVYYRRLQAGQIIAYDLSADGRGIDLTVFVNSPYDQFVTAGTRFWNASGLDVSVGAGGVEVRTESLVALIAGGLAFDTPPFVTQAEHATEKTVFTVYADRSAAMKAPEAVGSHFVLYFNESLRGLSAGAPVTLLGLPAGEVTDVGLDLDEKTLNIRGRVEIVTYPQRLVARLGRSQSTIGQTIQASAKQRQALLQHLVEQRSLRAQLRSGNLLTGQLFVALDYFPDSPKAKIDWNRDPTELPSVPSTLPNVEAKLSSIIAKLDNLPYDRIGSDVTTVLAGLNDTLKGASAALGRIDTDVTPELRTAIVELRSVMGTVDGMLKNQVNTTLGQLNTTLEELRVPLGTANTLLLNTDATLLSRNAPVQVELRETLQEVTRAARSLRVLMDYLERHPDSLIRGKTEEKP